MTCDSETPRECDLVVLHCNGCGEKRLTAQISDGRNLCSECMREVPVDERPDIAKGLPETEVEDAVVEPDTNQDWGANELRDVRKSAGLSQAELAKQSGLSQASISRWERGEIEPSRRKLKSLREALDGPDGAEPDA